MLLERGLLECDESYQVGEKSKWYRLGPALWRHKPSRTVIRDSRSVGRIKKLEAVQNNRDLWEPAHHHIAGWLQKTTVDEKQVAPWIRQRCRSIKQHVTALRVEVIQGGRATPKVDPYGRVHGAVVNLRSAARPALRINGKPLAEIDVSNAQPLLLGYVVAKVVANDWTVQQVIHQGEKASAGRRFSGYYKLSPSNSEEEDQQSNREQSNTRSGESTTICVPILHLSPISAELPADLDNYLSDCQHGNFYQSLGEAWGLPCDPGKAKNRIKRLTFKYILFGRSRPYKCYWKAVRGRWPTVSRVIEEIKSEDHGTVARACQRIEASLIIGGVVERFRLDYPDVPIQTIHDSVLVPPEWIDLAIAVIRQVFGTIGLVPGLKVKR